MFITIIIISDLTINLILIILIFIKWSDPTKLQLNKANSADTEALFLDLNLSITNSIVSSKIYDKWDDFNFEIVNFQFIDGDVPRSPSYGVYVSQLIHFARMCSNVDDINNRNLFLTAKVIDILKFENNFLNSTTDTQSKLLNTTWG